MILPHGAIVAVVDGQHFRLLRNAGTESHAELAELPSPSLDSSNRSGTGHHSHPGNHAETAVSEDAHAIAAVDWLNAEVLAGRIERLVVIAPPRTLGEMRRHYRRETERALLREVGKEVSAASARDILAVLKG